MPCIMSLSLNTYLVLSFLESYLFNNFAESRTCYHVAIAIAESIAHIPLFNVAIADSKNTFK